LTLSTPPKKKAGSTEMGSSGLANKLGRGMGKEEGRWDEWVDTWPHLLYSRQP